MLKPPSWPENLLGAVDREKAARGEALFKQRCQGCHGPHVADEARAQASAPLKPAGLEWRVEVIPLEHIGTDATAARGFIERRSDLSATGLSDAQLRDALRPLLTRNLMRDVRFRLKEVVRLRAARAAPLGDLSEALAGYPDPDRDPKPVVDLAAFAAIDSALDVTAPLPAIPGAGDQPPDPPQCDETCHLVNLLWDVRNGIAGVESTLAKIDVKKLSEGAALNLIGILIKDRFYADYGIDYATRQCLEGFGALDLPQEILGYKPRPLSGVWATPPYLHNGSVPTLYQMLLPPAKRDAKFFVGRREYDAVHVGYVTKPDEDGNDDGFWLDTSLQGNRNTGHAFEADAATWQKHLADPAKNPLPSGVIGPLFTDVERFDLIEYLKVHQDPPTPAAYRPPVCHLWGQAL
jgi:hypothetical protein